MASATSHDPAMLLTGNYYKVLGLSPGATKEDIDKAYKQQARHFHPDKNPNPKAEEWMKQINQAKEVLSDQIRRAKYDDELQNDDADSQALFESAGALLPGRQLSVKLMELFAVWLKEEKMIKHSQFQQSLKEFLDIFLKEKFKQWVEQQQPLYKKPIPKKPSKECLYSLCLDATNKVAKEISLLATDQVREIVSSVLQLSRTTSYKQYPSVIQPGTVVPLIDLSQADLSRLGTFFQLFFGDSDNKLSKKEMLATLMEFVPHVTVCAPMTKPGRSNCAMCNQRLPKKLLVYSTILPRLGQMRPQKICTSCHELTYHHDMNAWIEAGVGYLRTGGLSKIRPALGCFTLASSYCPHNIEPALKLTRTFLEIGVPEFGLPLLSDILKNHKEPIASMKAHLLASSSLKSMADWPNENLFEQWQLLFAAKEACVLALSASCSVDNLTDAPELSTRKSELDAAVYSHLEKIEDNYKSLVQTTLNALELAWSKRDWGQILNVLKEDTCEDDYNLAVLNNKHHHKIEALHQFVISKEGFLSKLLPDDRFPVLFLRAVLSVQKGQLSSGLKDLEAAAWNNHHTRWLLKEVIGIVLALLPNYTGSIMPFKALHITCNSLARGSGIHSSSPLFPTPDELLEPQKLHWEELTVPNLGMKGTRRFEQSVSRQVNAGKLTVRGAALTYIDYCLACQHPAECAICFLTASIWFLRELKQKATQAPKKYPELYALKNAVRWSLKHAGIITSLALHPGMRVYISRLGVVAMLHAVELAGHFSTPEDSKLVVHFLEMFTYNCRFCPFWHAPIVSVSEAVLLHIFTGQLHNEFILGLDDVSLISVPLSKSELRYQLYENELRHLNPSQNPAEVHRNAMCALLQEKKWSFDDVVHLMTSPLSPRTPDGWLIQQPTLGRNLEYTKFAGFVVDPNAASIQLLVVPARLSPRRVGLFSRSDINTVLQLGKDDLLPVFFSLDPPNENQQFHPFQQIRYFPESLYETDLLHTLFETDYLLKSFSVGCEVSSVPPFSQRPCSKGLTASLPSKLRDILKPISARGDRSSHINRFWIQAEKLVYSTVQVDSQVKFLFSDPVMAIHTHPQLPGQDGLQDTEDDPDPHSPEAKFAADLTSNYRKISEHFPMFARLQELVKLQFFGIVLNNIIESVKEMVNSTDIDVPDELLQAIHADQRSSKMETINEMLSNIYDQVKWHYNLSTSSEIQSQIVDALMETTSYKLSRWTLSDYVANWLYTKNEYTQSQLASYICSSVPLVTRNEVKNMLLEQRRKTFQPFLSLVQSLQLAARRGAPKKRANGCNWVPAALNKMDDEDTVSLCYGGVLIAPKVVQGSVPLVQNVSRVSLTPSAASQAGSSGTGQSGGGSGNGGGGGHGGSGGRGGGGHSGGGRRLNLNDPRYQWSHVFHTKPGHVEPKYNSSQERFKKLFAHVAYYGTESKDPRVALNQKHGDNVKEMQYRKGTVWVRYTKEGVVKSAGVNR